MLPSPSCQDPSRRKPTWRSLRRAWAFARGWQSQEGDRVQVKEITLPRPGGSVPVSLYRPASVEGPLPGWVVLHGITRPGRHHPVLVRFVRALASSGATVLLPEIPEWRELALAPDAAQETLEAAVRHGALRADVAAGGVGILGFSFGVPRILQAAADPDLRRYVKVAAGFGGYASLEEALRFQFTGEHTWQGVHHRADPDPYGRWVIAGNLLPKAAGFAQAGPVAEALLELARAAGDAQVGAWEAEFDDLKNRLETRLRPEHRELFRAFAPPAGTLPPRVFAESMVPRLAQAARRASPLHDPLPYLPAIRTPVHLIHGRQDRLIPFTETLRLAASFPPGAPVRSWLTGLFGHSRGGLAGNPWRAAREGLHFLRMIGAVLGSI